MSESPLVLAQRIADNLGILGTIHPLGKSNQNNWNWQVGQMVLKIFIPNEEDPLEDTPRWERESHALRLVAPQGFAPTLRREIVTNSGIHAHIRDYIPGKNLKDLNSTPVPLDEIALILQKIHTAHVRPKDHLLEGSLDWYLNRCRKTLLMFEASWDRYPIPTNASPGFAKDLFEHSVVFIQSVAKAFPLDKLSLVHGDLLLTNIILSDTSDRLTLIDWEYSGYRDPLADVSYLLSQNPGLEPYREEFLQVYCDYSRPTKDENEFRSRLMAHDLVLDWIFALWSANRALEIISGKRIDFDKSKTAVDSIWHDYETKIARINEKLDHDEI
ncbi:MAG: phosphotransferase [Candidatus Hodarchaeota archaeon]